MRASRLVTVGICLALLGSAVHAQFDVTWAAFEPDPQAFAAPGGGNPTNVTLDGTERDLAAGDLDRDGWTDLVVVRRMWTASPRYSVLLMNELGQLVDRTSQFATASDVQGDAGFLAPTTNLDVVMVDVDQDGWLDVVTSTGQDITTTTPAILTPRVYRNQGLDANGHWRGLRFEHLRIPVGSPPTLDRRGVAAGDVNGDGYPDLYFAARGYPVYSDALLLNDGTGHFVEASSAAGFTYQMLYVQYGTGALIVDVNGDGARDIVRSSGVLQPLGQNPSISIAWNDPLQMGQFSSALFQVNVSGEYPWSVDVGDLNNDQKPDLVFPTDFQDGYRLQIGLDAQGRATWGPVMHYAFVTGADEGYGGNVHIVDLDGDGWNDVIQTDQDAYAVGCSTPYCHVYHNLAGVPGGAVTLREEAGLANGAWRGAVGLTPAQLAGTFDVAAFDVDNDTDVDLVLARCQGTYLWRNQKLVPPPIATFCSGDGSGSPCPCGLSGAVGQGCPNSVFAGGARLAGSGQARIQGDSLRLVAQALPGSLSLFLSGSVPVPSGNGLPLGDGLLCALGGFTRLGLVAPSSSTALFPSLPLTPPIHVATGVQAGDLRVFQVCYRDPAPGFCTSATFNSTNAVTVTWAP